MNDYAKTSDVAKEFDEAASLQRTEIQKVYSWGTPLELTSKLQTAQHDMNQRVLAIETTLPCKVDRSDVKELELLAESLRRYDSFVQHTDTELKELRERTTTHMQQLEEHSDRLSAVDQNILAMAQRISLLTTKQEFSGLSATVDQHTKKFESCVQTSTFDNLSIRVLDCETTNASLTHRSSDLEIAILQLQKDLQLKASNVDVKRCVLRNHFEEAIAVLGDSIDSKASLGDVIKIDRRVEVQ